MVHLASIISPKEMYFNYASSKKFTSIVLNSLFHGTHKEYTNQYNVLPCI